MSKVILIATAIIALLLITIVLFLGGKKDIVDGAIEMGLSLDQSAGAKIGFTITGMTLIAKDGKRYTLARSGKFKSVNKSSQSNGILSLGESGLYVAKGKIIPREEAIKKLEQTRGNNRYIAIPEYDVFVTDILEKQR